jgi:hypothetical protein
MATTKKTASDTKKSVPARKRSSAGTSAAAQKKTTTKKTAGNVKSGTKNTTKSSAASTGKTAGRKIPSRHRTAATGTSGSNAGGAVKHTVAKHRTGFSVGIVLLCSAGGFLAGVFFDAALGRINGAKNSSFLGNMVTIVQNSVKSSDKPNVRTVQKVKKSSKAISMEDVDKMSKKQLLGIYQDYYMNEQGLSKKEYTDMLSQLKDSFKASGLSDKDFVNDLKDQVKQIVGYKALFGEDISDTGKPQQKQQIQTKSAVQKKSAKKSGSQNELLTYDEYLSSRFPAMVKNGKSREQYESFTAFLKDLYAKEAKGKLSADEKETLEMFKKGVQEGKKAYKEDTMEYVFTADGSLVSKESLRAGSLSPSEIEDIENLSIRKAGTYMAGLNKTERTDGIRLYVDELEGSRQLQLAHELGTASDLYTEASFNRFIEDEKESLTERYGIDDSQFIEKFLKPWNKEILAQYADYLNDKRDFVDDAGIVNKINADQFTDKVQRQVDATNKEVNDMLRNSL